MEVTVMATVLVVDDAAFMRMRLQKVLTANGHQVIEAGNGAEAVEAYEANRPDVVLMDITMPVMDGLEALRTIKSKFPEAKIIMCSALGQESTVIEAIKSGAKDFIVKPFQPEVVLGAIQKQVG